MTYETSLRPYFVKMACGHAEIRLMREATARMPWTPEATVIAQAKCRVCAFQPVRDWLTPKSENTVHERDTQCCLDVSDPSVCSECIVCGVTFGEPCPTCRGRGFHFPGCASEMCLKTWNGLHCEKEARHVGHHSYVPRCEGGA